MVLQVMLVTTQHVTKSIRSVKTAKTTGEIGVTCLSTNWEDPTVVALGTEAGAIFQGSLTTTDLVHDEASAGQDLYDPVVAAFQGHYGGQVVDIKFSPFHRDIFLSLGSDKEASLKVFTSSTQMES